MNLREIGYGEWKVDENGSYPVAGFGIKVVELLYSAARKLVN
jgi:hypothetical protein